MTPEELVHRGNKARQILEEPLVKEAFSIMERDVIELFYNCPQRDTEGMVYLQQNLRNVRKLKDLLLGVMETGKLEANKLQRKSNLKETMFNSLRR